MKLQRLDYINLFHILAVAPALGYIGYSGYAAQRSGRPLPAWTWTALMVTAAIVLSYHSYRIYSRHSQ